HAVRAGLVPLPHAPAGRAAGERPLLSQEPRPRLGTVLRAVDRGVDVAVPRLEAVRAVQIGERLRAAPELRERVAEVVVRVALVRVGRAGADEPADGAADQPER